MASSFVSVSSASEANAEAYFSTPVVWSTLAGEDGHLSTLTPARSTWTAEEAVAEAMGGHLVSINSQAAQDLLNSTFLVGSTAAVPLWIGLTDIPPTGSTNYSAWTTGEPVMYTNFNPSEPNNQNGDEHYVAMNWHYSFGSSDTMSTWDDLPNGGSTVSYNPPTTGPSAPTTVSSKLYLNPERCGYLRWRGRSWSAGRCIGLLRPTDKADRSST